MLEKMCLILWSCCCILKGRDCHCCEIVGLFQISQSLSCANAVVFDFSGLTFFADMPVKMGCRGWDNLCPCCKNDLDPCGGYAADWHNEWAHGDFPNYKQIYENKEAVSQ